MNRRLAGVVGALLLATVGTLVLVTYVRDARDQALAGGPTAAVLVLDESVPKGTPAAALEKLVTTREVPTEVQADGAVASLSELTGVVATVDLVAGEQLVRSRFVEPASLERPGLPAGMLEVTVTLSPDRAVGGRLQRGDRVGVIASFDDGQASGTPGSPEKTTHLILHKVAVTNVQFADGKPANTGAAKQDGVGDSPEGALLVSLALDAPAVEKVVFAAEHGRLWLTAEPSSVAETGTKVQTLRSVYS